MIGSEDFNEKDQFLSKRRCVRCDKRIPHARIHRRGGGRTTTCSEECSILHSEEKKAQKKEYDHNRYLERKRKAQELNAQSV